MPPIQPIQMKQLRFEYSKAFSQLLEDFTKQHLHDDRKTYKTNWNSWKNQNNNIYNIEIERIKQDGYNGCPHAKIFESVRYYYRKKQLKHQNTNQPNHNQKINTQKSKNKLKGLSKTIKQSMDNHMKTIVLEKNNTENKDTDLSPASAFNDFCRTNMNDLIKEIYRLKQTINVKLDPIEIDIKFKKAYKNRFYKFIKSIQ